MSAREAKQRPGTTARFPAVALVLLFALSQIGGFAHLALVRHGRCAEDGELIDVRGEAGPAAVAPPAEGQGLAPAPLAGADHRHDHCAAAPQRREQAAGCAPRHGFSLLGPVALRPPPPVPAPASGATALYRLAPKTSPPV